MSDRRWWRRRWVVVALLLLVVVIAVRAGLPWVLRKVLVSQANSRIAGRVTIADVDLWLLRGAVAVWGVELRGEVPAGAASGPRVAFRRLLVDVSWLPLLRRTVVFDEIALDGPEIDVGRRPDGRVLLPRLRDDPEAAEPPATEPTPPWNVIVTAARLRDGKLVLDDRLPDPPKEVALSLDGLELLGFHLLHDAGAGEPGTGTIEAHFGDGTARLETSLGTRPAGFAVMAALTLDNLPLDRLHVHVPEVDWTDFSGRLDGKVELHLEPDGLPIVWGTLALRDVQVDAPGEEEPALAWRRLDLDVERIDVAQRTAAVRRVALEGVGVLVRPLAVPPLPLLPRATGGAAVDEAPAPGGGVGREGEGEVAPGAEAVEGVTTGATASAGLDQAPDHDGDAAASRGNASGSSGSPPAGSAPAPPAWSWSVARVEVADGMAKVFLAPPPLEVGIVTLQVDGLSSAPDSRARVSVELREGDGSVTLTGEVAREPLAANLQVGLRGLALERYATALGVTPPLLRHGELGADLKLGFGDGPATLSGELVIADLDLAPPEGEQFALAWQRLEIDIAKIGVPGVPGVPGAPSGEAGAAGPVRAHLTRVKLAEPRIGLTRTADGVVLPAVTLAPGEARSGDRGTPPGAGTTVGATTEPEPEAGTARQGGATLATSADEERAAPAASSKPRHAPSEGVADDAATSGEAPPEGGARAEPPVVLRLDALEVEGGEVAVLDRTVKPFYRGRLRAIALDARELSWPGNRFRDVRLTAKAPGGAPLELHARQEGGVIDATAETRGLALPPLNPYVTDAAGYSIASGRFTLSSKLRLDPDGYRSESELAFDDLDVAGAEGDALFTERFGVSLSLALALLRDVSGRIALDVPVSGDASGAVRPEIAPIVADALSDALLNALASPLKLLGAVSLDGDKVAAFAPEPIEFVVGRAEVADDAWWRIEQLTGVLAASPALRVELVGAAGPRDLRALREAAVLADLQEEEGFLTALRNLPSRGTRNAIRDALVARAAGEQATLDDEQSAQLEEWIAAKPIGDAELSALARARAERLRDLLSVDYGVPTDRVVLGEAAPHAVLGEPRVAVRIAPLR